MTKQQLIRMFDALRTDLGRYVEKIPEASELELLSKEQLLDVLMGIETSLYVEHNESKYQIAESFNEAYKDAVRVMRY